MKKRIFLTAVLIVCAIISALTLTACGDGSGDSSENGYTVTFDCNGGKYESDGIYLDYGMTLSADGGKLSVSVPKDGALLPPETAPVRDGNYAFCGWAKDKEGNELWDFDGNAPSSSLTLYATWSVTFDFKLSDSKMHYSVRGLGGLSGDVEIPETHNGKPVTEILPNAFKNESRLTGIVIPDSVVSVGRAAFSSANNLLSASVGNGVEVLPEQVFNKCSKLETVYLPSSLKKIEGQAFSECGALSNVYFGGTVDEWCSIEIGAYIILNQNYEEPANPLSGGKAKLYIDGVQATSITVNAETVRDYAFYGCGTVNSVTVGSGVRTIGYMAFSECSLGSLNFEEGMTEIGYRAFYDCDALTEVTLPDSTERVGTEAFKYCDGLTSLDLGGAKYINESAFEDCYELAELDLGGAEELGGHAFSGDEKLTSLTVPDSVWYIGSGCFTFCDELNSVTFASNASSASWYLSVPSETKILTSENLASPAKNATELTKAYQWLRIYGEPTFTLNSDKNSYALSGVSGTGYGVVFVPAQYEGKNVTDIYYDSALSGDGIKSIIVDSGNAACTARGGIFYNKEMTQILWVPKWLKGSVEIADGVTGINMSVFDNCAGITEIVIPGSAETVTDTCTGCSSLTSIIILDGVKYIGADEEHAFSNRYKALTNIPSLKNIVIPDSVTSIAKDSFSGCAIETATVPTFAVKYIANEKLKDAIVTSGETVGDFLGLGNLESVTICDGITHIGSNAFKNCSALTSLTIPDSVTAIGIAAFEDCTELKNVTIGSGVTEIGNYAFGGCENLESIIIPDSATNIGEYAFLNCKNLKSIIIGNGVTEIGEAAFNGCTGLENVMIGNGLTSIRAGMFEGCGNLKSVVIGNGVKTIGGGAFAYCTSLKRITIPSGVTEIGSAFRNCSNLSSVKLPDSLTTIGDKAFEECYNLQSVFIGSGVTYIGYLAFTGHLPINIIYNGLTEQWKSIEKAEQAFSGSIKIHCTDGDIEAP